MWYWSNTQNDGNGTLFVGSAVRDMLYLSGRASNSYFGMVKSCKSMVVDAVVNYGIVAKNNKSATLVSKTVDQLVDMSQSTVEYFIAKADGVLEQYGHRHGFFTVETVEVIELFHQMFVELLNHMSIERPMQVVVGASKLLRQHSQMKYSVPKSNSNKPLLEEKDDQEKKIITETTDHHALHFETVQQNLRYALTSYGSSALMVFGIATEYLSAFDFWYDDKAHIKSLGHHEDEILVNVFAGDHYRPGHFVVLEHGKKQLIVSIRGTKQFHDIVIDLNCIQTDIQVNIDGEVLRGSAHRGFWRSAVRLAEELESVVMRALEEFQDYEVVLTGHSLGGGVATLLTLIWLQNDIMRQRNIHCYAYGAPCSLCYRLARHPLLEKHVTAFVLGNDVVSRLSFATVKEVGKSIAKLGIQQDHDDIHYEPVEEKLYPSGTVWFFDGEENGTPQRIDPVDHLRSIQLTPSMITYHFPNNMMNALATRTA